MAQARWVARMSASAAGAKEVRVKISVGGRDADGVQAHLEYIDRHVKTENQMLAESLAQKSTELVSRGGRGGGSAETRVR